MKKRNYWMIILMIGLTYIQTSCEKFLDVSAENQVIEEDLFKDGNGFHIAVNGVYRSLSGTELYGRHLTWGFISGLGGNYAITSSLPQEINYGSDFQWDYSSVINTTDQIWRKGYNVIANANNVIQKVEERDSSFFKEGQLEKNLILGQMIGIRAMMHFDLLRLFAPAPITGFKGKAIPYVVKYPEIQPMPLDFDQVYQHIVEDMEQSKSLLANIDTITLREYMTSLAGRIRQSNTWRNNPRGDFFNYSAQRMNFFSATGLLARIYLYKGDYANAYTNAKLVYDYHKKNWFRWTATAYQGQISDVSYVHTKRPEEILLCFSNNKNYDNFESLIGGTNIQNNAFQMNNMDILFAGDLDDYRKVGWYNRYNDKRYLTWIRPRGTSTIASDLIANQGPLLPVLRFSEMYHIIIECLNKEGKTTDAVNIFNVLRANRGAKAKIATNISSKDLQAKLENDIIRETLTEGQTFYMFKRLNQNIFNGDSNRIMKSEDWVAPIPPSENAYQY